MKIVQFMASEGWGGAEKVLVELSNDLAKHCDVTVILLRNTVYKSRFSKNIKIKELRSNPTKYNPLLALEIYFLLKKIQPEIVHTHADKATELIARANKLLNFKHIGTKHNVRKGSIFNKIPNISTVSSTVTDSIKYQSGRNISIIHNGIRPVALNNALAKKKNQPFTILAIGRLDKIKGFDTLIAQVKKLTFDFKLIIIGQGPEEISLNDQIEQARIENKIILHGYEENIPLMMKNCDLVVVSSLSEGFCKVIIEGLFYAPLLISTPVGIAIDILPEQMIVNQNRLGEKITEVYNDQERFNNLFIEVKKNKSEQFLMEKITANYIDLYKSVLLESSMRC